jgi:hypothetical protein
MLKETRIAPLAVLGRSEQTRFYRLRATTKSASCKARSAPRCSRRRSAGGADETAEKEPVLQCSRFVGSDEDGGSTANIAASEASHQTKRAKASAAIKLALGRLDSAQVLELSITKVRVLGAGVELQASQ